MILGVVVFIICETMAAEVRGVGGVYEEGCGFYGEVVEILRLRLR